MKIGFCWGPHRAKDHPEGEETLFEICPSFNNTGLCLEPGENGNCHDFLLTF
jgi:hypothetical protein